MSKKQPLTKQGLILLLQSVQCGDTSCLCAAKRIMKHVPKKRMTDSEKRDLKILRRSGKYTVHELAVEFDVNESTVWRVCKEKK